MPTVTDWSLCPSCGRSRVAARGELCSDCRAPAPKGGVRLLEGLLNSSPLAFVGVALYWAFTYSGPYRYLAEWQSERWGSYYPALCLVVLLVPPTLAVALLRKVLGLGPMPRNVAEMLPLSGRETHALFVPAVVLFGFLGLGAYFYSTGVSSGDLRRIHADDLLSGKLRDPFFYAEVRGFTDQRTVSRTRDSEIPMLYVPLHGSGGMEEAVPVVIEVQEDRLDEYVVPQFRETGEVTVRGLAEQAVPSEVEPYLREQGVRLAEPCWLIRPAVDPAQRKTAAFVLAGLGVVLATFFYFMRRRSGA